MALDPGSALGQAENANSQLADYFNKLNKFLSGSGAPPDFEDYVGTLDYSELHRMTSLRATDASSYENGAAIENIHLMAAVIREYGMRRKNKLDYYSNAETDAMNESNFYAASKTYWVSMLNGNYSESDLK